MMVETLSRPVDDVERDSGLRSDGLANVFESVVIIADLLLIVLTFRWLIVVLLALRDNNPTKKSKPGELQVETLEMSGDADSKGSRLSCRLIRTRAYGSSLSWSPHLRPALWVLGPELFAE